MKRFYKNIMVIGLTLALSSPLCIMANTLEPLIIYDIAKTSNGSKIYVGIDNLPSNTSSLQITLKANSPLKISDVQFDNSLKDKKVSYKVNGNTINLIIISKKDETLKEVGDNLPIANLILSNNVTLDKASSFIKYVDILGSDFTDNTLEFKQEDILKDLPPATNTTTNTTTNTSNGGGGSSSDGAILNTADKNTVKDKDKDENVDTKDKDVSITDNTATSKFSDVSNHWSSPSVAYMTEKGYITGFKDGTFRPNKPMTRAEISTVLSKIFDIKRTTTKNPFKDVQKGNWYEDYALALYDAGLITGLSSDEFGANKSITNQDLAVILTRTMKKYNIILEPSIRGDLPFSDTSKIKDYAKSSVSYLYERELLHGNANGTYEPQKEATRAQISALLERIDKLR